MIGIPEKIRCFKSFVHIGFNRPKFSRLQMYVNSQNHLLLLCLLSSNPILKEYEKAYKRNYARATHKKISKESFRAWAEEAANKRDVLSAKYLADPDENLVKEFKQYLGNR